MTIDEKRNRRRRARRGKARRAAREARHAAHSRFLAQSASNVIRQYDNQHIRDVAWLVFLTATMVPSASQLPWSRSLT